MVTGFATPMQTCFTLMLLLSTSQLLNICKLLMLPCSFASLLPCQVPWPPTVTGRGCCNQELQGIPSDMELAEVKSLGCSCHQRGHSQLLPTGCGAPTAVRGGIGAAAIAGCSSSHDVQCLYNQGACYVSGLTLQTNLFCILL